MPWTIVTLGLLVAFGGVLVAADRMPRAWRIGFGLLLIPCGLFALVAWWFLGIAVMLGGLFIAVWPLGWRRFSESDALQ